MASRHNKKLREWICCADHSGNHRNSSCIVVTQKRTARMMFRKMEWTDIPSGLSLCRSAGWNQLSRDWEIFLMLDPQANRVCVDDEGNVVGTVTTIRYGNHFAWIGMVLVDPNHQRKGIGLGLLEQS